MLETTNRYSAAVGHRFALQSLLAYFSTLIMAFSASPNAVAKEFLIRPGDETRAIAKEVTAGDAIVLKDGEWQDAKLAFERLPGTSDAPIEIRPQTPGGVRLTGATEFRISGSYVHLNGFVFRNCGDVSDVVQFRTHSERLAENCRISNCSFEESDNFQNPIESRWLSIYGKSNRIDHCYFAGKKNRGTTLVVWVTKTPGQHRIDHNHFGPRPELGRNGGETIRIGTSDVSELDSQTRVEHNYFDRCNGEAEIVSNKSCGNVYRRNLFEQCSGALTLRHGHRCWVDGNIFLGKQSRGTGGVRIIGQGHRVTNNYFEGLRGDAERAAVCFMNGVPDGELNTYSPVRDAEVSHNTMIDCKVSMEFGVGEGGDQTANPSDSRIRNNVFAPGKWSTFRVQAEPRNFLWKGNKHQPKWKDDSKWMAMELVDLPFERASDGLLRPTDVESLVVSGDAWLEKDIDYQSRGEQVIAGCDDPSTSRATWPSADNTGPTWKSR
ncbi:MAG: polysaccharide lyase 6 family protein [Rubripirellula sp.]